MCGRYSHSEKMGEISDLVRESRIVLRARHNIAPRQSVPVALWEDRAPALRILRWGLVPSWAADTAGADRLANARSETAHIKPSFRHAFARSRCLVLASSWFEWTTQGGRRVPWRILPAEHSPLITFAGLHESWLSPDARLMPPDQRAPLRTFCILTAPAIPCIGHVHDRMPAIIPPEHWEEWLQPGTPAPRLHQLLRPAPGLALTAHRVTARVNQASFEDPAALIPLSDEEIAAEAAQQAAAAAPRPRAKPGASSQLSLWPDE